LRLEPDFLVLQELDRPLLRLHQSFDQGVGIEAGYKTAELNDCHKAFLKVSDRELAASL
jgi:hypothetical protein